jgi:nucleotide-binding universal stress UspA family protein
MKTKSANKQASTPPPLHSGQEPAPEAPEPVLASRPLSLKQILVPIDFSDCSISALGYARALAQKFGAKLVLLNVVEPAAYPENYLVTPASLDEANQNLLAAAQERLGIVKQRAIAHGLTVEALVRMGRAQSEIPDTAKAIGADLIVMGTNGYSRVKQVLLGGTAERVVRHSTCPVLTVRHP